MEKPLIFIAMPFGKKRDPLLAHEIDFDAVYEHGIRPAVAGLDVEIIRADEERSGGVIHLPMFERLLVAEIAVVDVTLENANVFYELGIRHAARPRATIIIRANTSRMPFDISMIRAITYDLNDGVLTPAAAAELSAVLAARLTDALADLESKDSPLFQLIPTYPGIDLPHAECENFRDRVKVVNDMRDRLAAARRLPRDAATVALASIERELGPITTRNAESAVDVVLSYRDVEAFDDMIALIERFPAALRDKNITLREQLALALNRRREGDDRERALTILHDVVAARGDSPETCSLIGRIYKDLYREATESGDDLFASGNLESAIEWYRRGFLADPRDFYPGVNLATLLVLEGGPQAEEELRGVSAALSFALARLTPLSSRDYWLVATLLEVSILSNQPKMADRALARLLTLTPTLMQLRTTRNNLTLILNAQPSDVDVARLTTITERFTREIEKLEAPTAPLA